MSAKCFVQSTASIVQSHVINTGGVVVGAFLIFSIHRAIIHPLERVGPSCVLTFEVHFFFRFYTPQTVTESPNEGDLTRLWLKEPMRGEISNICAQG